MTSTGGGEGRWPFERVNEGPAAPVPASGPGAPPVGGPAGGPVGGPAGGPAGGPLRASALGPGSGPAQGPGSGPEQGQATGLGFGADATAPYGGSAAPGSSPRTSSGSAEPPAPGRRDRQTPPPRRRPPLWLLILIGLVVVGGVVTAVLLLTDRETPEAPPAETVTLPVPTPTIEPVERAEGTPFAGALPSTVRQFALTELVEHEPFLVAGALEGYRLTYSDGGDTTLVLLAGQWRDAAGPAAQLDAVLAQVGEVPEATEEPGEPEPEEQAEEASDPAATASATPTAEPLPSPAQGPVEVDGQEVGRYVFLPREDGTGTLWWTNSTVFLQLDGPWTELRDVFAAFPL